MMQRMAAYNNSISSFSLCRFLWVQSSDFWMKSVGIWHSITIYSRMIGSVDAQANIKKNEARNMYQETW